jgi:hypothetical protein
MDYGLPLTPVADMCRTARHALGLVATARPQLFITTLAREVCSTFIGPLISFLCVLQGHDLTRFCFQHQVARYNTLQQNAQTLNVNLSTSVLARAKADMLRALAKLFESRQAEVTTLMVEVSYQLFLHVVISSCEHNQGEAFSA